jgi:hypothetical protein
MTRFDIPECRTDFRANRQASSAAGKAKCRLPVYAEIGSFFVALCLLGPTSGFQAEQLRGEEQPSHAHRVWPSQPPADCPFPKSTELAGIAFTGRFAHYNDDNKNLSHMIGDTWYPSWAADGNLYSPWTDGFLRGFKSASWAGEKATTGHAAILGDDPLRLSFANVGVHAGSAAPYAGRYPCANLVYNGVWYLGTYCLNDSEGDPNKGLNWDILGPFVGFRYSRDYGKTWTDTPHTPARPLFPEPAKVGGTLKMGVPHVVDFGKNMQHSPDGKAYLVCHGATDPDPKPRPANLSWVTGDQIYLARVTPSPENMNDMSKYEFFAGHDEQEQPIWTHDFSKIKPLLDWNNNCGGAAVTYNPGLKKYLMCVNDGNDTVSKMHTYILESDRITGPWKLVVYMRNFGEQAYFSNIPSKFISADGRTAWLCYSANFTNVALPKLPKLKFDPPAGHPVGEAAPMVWQEIKLLPLTATDQARVGPAPASTAVKSVRLVLPPQPSPVLQNIGRVFVRQIESRCDAKVVSKGDAPLTVELMIEPGIGEEGYKIADGPNGTIRIIGNDARGVLYGVGKFLHTSVFGSQGFSPSAWRGTSVPKMPHRLMYLASHFQNYYQVAPIEDVTRYVEDLSLWGVNGLVVWFGMEEFNGINDPKAQAMLVRLRALLKTAKDLGLSTGIGGVGNDGYRNTPSELRATMVPFNQGVELCPNKPGVVELELQFCQEKFEAFKSVGLDYWFIVPYDNGGCGCEKCAPWGINGFLKVAEPEARAFRRAYPKGKVVMSTWYFDHPQIFSGEWAGLTAKFKAKKPDWVDCIMADNFEAYPRYPLDNGVPGGLPLLNFPDISMYGQNPWGGYGANPHPGRLQQRWDETKKHLSGGMPYSEGVYEDLNKVICAQFYWDRDHSAMQTVKEYAAFEFSPEVAEDVATVVEIFEKNHQRDQVGESAVNAYQLVEQADAKLTPQARSAWRWRLFCIRAAIDQEIYRNSLGQGRDKVFRQACDELTKISRAENVWSVLRPVPIPAVNVEGPGLPANYTEAIAASKPVAWWRMDKFHDRNITDATERKNEALFENGVTLMVPGNRATNADEKPNDRAACFAGGRMTAAIEKLPDSYSVEFWLYNTLPNTARPVTAYIFSRGVAGPEGTPGDNLGISGTSSVNVIPPGRLFFYNGDAAKQVMGKTELALETWNHVVLVRNGKKIAVYLNGRSTPEVFGEMEKGYPDGVTQLFVGGRNDNFANFQGRIADVSVYDRALTPQEAEGHHNAAGQNAIPSK